MLVSVRRSPLRVAFAVLAVLALVAASSVTASSLDQASGAPAGVPANSDPAANVPIPSSYNSTCVSAPQSSACYSVLEAMLNRGRSAVGKAPYGFSSIFTSLTPREQLLALTNQDRSSYGLPLVSGMNATLQSAANSGASARVDPSPVAKVSGYSWQAYGSTVFTTINYVANPLFAYFNWMYNDGPGGANSDCSTRNTAYCWIHRHINLTSYSPGSLIIEGIGTASSRVAVGSTTDLEATLTQLFETFPNALAIPTIPTIIAINPASAPRGGGTTVSVVGYGFRSVSIATECAMNATSITVKSNNSLTITTARSGPDRSNIAIKTSGGLSSATAADAFTCT